MPALISCNQRTEEMVSSLKSLDPGYRLYMGSWAQRMARCLRGGDVMVFPMAMSEELLRYLTAALGIARDSAEALGPPSGRPGEDILSQDRLTGEMRVKPVLHGLIVLAPPAGLPALPGLPKAVRKLCRPIHAMGYRGIVSIDVIVAPDRDIVVNEFNCRTGGSTRIHRVGERVVGDDCFEERVLVELLRCTFPLFTVTVEALAGHGSAYDPAARTGV
ncbi:hypothetical protein NGM37_22735, partial [Streptomyces sp. TRM76130]|nr:hypothetical protein [Streptomyces sp. TRM76130]